MHANSSTAATMFLALAQAHSPILLQKMRSPRFIVFGCEQNRLSVEFDAATLSRERQP